MIRLCLCVTRVRSTIIYFLRSASLHLPVCCERSESNFDLLAGLSLFGLKAAIPYPLLPGICLFLPLTSLSAPLRLSRRPSLHKALPRLFRQGKGGIPPGHPNHRPVLKSSKETAYPLVQQWVAGLGLVARRKHLPGSRGTLKI